MIGGNGIQKTGAKSQNAVGMTLLYESPLDLRWQMTIQRL